MDDTVKIEREKRRIQRKRKRQRSSIVTIMILFILTSVGVVSAQTQGYEIFYHGESLGFVHKKGCASVLAQPSALVSFIFQWIFGFIESKYIRLYKTS